MNLVLSPKKLQLHVMRAMFLIILMSTSLALKSQPKEENKSSFDEQIYQQLIGKSYIDKSLVNKGIFFRNTFLPGKIVFASGDSIDKVFIRYECLSKKLIWLSDGYGQIELDDLSIKSFELRNADTSFLFAKRTVKALGDTTPQFYQIFAGNNIGLIALRKVVRKDSYMKKKKFYIYAPAPVFVFKIQDKTYTLKSLKLKSLFDLFPDKKEAILKQLRRTPFQIKNENDFVAFLQIIEPILLEK